MSSDQQGVTYTVHRHRHTQSKIGNRIIFRLWREKKKSQNMQIRRFAYIYLKSKKKNKATNEKNSLLNHLLTFHLLLNEMTIKLDRWYSWSWLMFHKMNERKKIAHILTRKICNFIWFVSTRRSNISHIVCTA